MEKRRPVGKVEKINIPGEAIPDWINVLLEGGFSAAEAEELIENISPDYRSMSQKKQTDLLCTAIDDWIQKEMKNGINPSIPKDASRRIQENLEKFFRDEEEKKSGNG